MLFLVNCFLTIVVCLTLGVVVYFRNPKNTINRYFFAMAICIGLWILTLYVYYTTQLPSILLWFGRANFAAPTLAVFFLYKFVLEFPRRNIELPKISSWILGIVVWVTAVIAGLTGLVDLNETLVDGERVMQFGSLYGVWIAIFLLTLTLSFSVLLLKISKSYGQERVQTQLILLALGLSFGFGFMTNAILPYVFGVHSFEPIGPIGGFILTGLTAYAIIKHRFLDITAVVARAVTYTLILLIVVALEVGYLYAMVWLLPSSVDRVLVAASGAVVIVLGYDYLRGQIVKLTEKIFYQGRYDTEDLLARLTAIMASTIDIKKLSNSLLSALVDEMRLSCGAFVLLADHKARLVAELGWSSETLLSMTDIHELWHRGEETLVFEDMEEGEVKEKLRQAGITVVLPLRRKNEEIGLLLLGPKASGEVYAPRDLELLSIFGPQVAVALENAESFRQIAEFNKTLEQKVEERTGQLEAEQKERLARVRELLRIKDEFVFIATHDLATPVTAIAGFVELVKTQIKKLPTDVRDDIEAIDEATVRLRALVDDLLEVARGESGTIKVKLAPVDLTKTVKSAVALIAERAKHKKIQIKLNLDQKHNLVLADQAKLSEVFENLLSNGVKYNREGGKLEIASRAQGGSVVIEVADTGIGIPFKEQGRVFNKFYRSESLEARKETGTGLGLFVVKMLVERMRGKIVFVSKEGEGTTFTLTFYQQ